MVEVIVEYDYTAKEPDELTIKKGDIIKDVVKKQGGWWEGVLKDKKGMFPDNFVRPLDKDPSVVLRNKKDVSRIRQCRVIFSYNQDHEDELNLNVGDIISIIGEEEEGWWRGNLNGKEGVFPSNFVEEIVAQPSRPKPSSREDLISIAGEADKAPKLPVKPIKQLCEARYPYKAQNEDELTFKECDIITLISKDSQDPGWWKGELNGKVGVFPDNFVTLIPNGDEKVNKDEKKSSKVVTETSAIKPSSIASQRKSLEVKSEKTNSDPSPIANKTPPLPGKKPLIPIKKSPSGSSSGIFSEIKKKIHDVVDGATGSKSAKTEVPETKESSSENVFDQVERRSLLTDVRATRAKAPGRRLPTSVHKEEDTTILNGNADHLIEPSEPLPSSINSASEPDSAEKPRLREWEKHKAPWLEEMKLNQAKRTSTSPGPENKLKLTPTNDKNVDAEENKSSKSSPVEKEVDMSKSMPAIDLSKSLSSLNSKLKTPPNELDKAPTIRMKPVIQPVAIRQSLGNNQKDIPTAARHTVNITSTVNAAHPVKPTAPAPPKASPTAAVTTKSPVTSQRPAATEKTSEAKPVSDNPEVVSHKHYSDLLERVHKLEALVERQNQAIEELKNKLQVETDMRMLLQEKVLQNVQV